MNRDRGIAKSGTWNAIVNGDKDLLRMVEPGMLRAPASHANMNAIPRHNHLYLLYSLCNISRFFLYL